MLMLVTVMSSPGRLGMVADQLIRTRRYQIRNGPLQDRASGVPAPPSRIRDSSGAARVAGTRRSHARIGYGPPRQD